MTSTTAEAMAIVRKSDPHQKLSISAPEVSTPMMPPIETEAVHIATPRDRFSGGSVAVIVESVAGKTNAAPRPETARAMISCVGVSRKIVTTLAIARMARPMSRIRRRPNLSPMAPIGSSSEARTTA